MYRQREALTSGRSTRSDPSRVSFCRARDTTIGSMVSFILNDESFGYRGEQRSFTPFELDHSCPEFCEP